VINFVQDDSEDTKHGGNDLFV